MSYRPEDLELDEGYWKSLLAEAEGELTGSRRTGAPHAADQTAGHPHHSTAPASPSSAPTSTAPLGHTPEDSRDPTASDRRDADPAERPQPDRANIRANDRANDRAHLERPQVVTREPRATFSAHSEPPREQIQQWWEMLHEAMALHHWLDVEVTGVNRGGLIVHFHTLRGFVPSSHLASVSPDMDEPTRRGVLANHLGQRLHLRVIELEPAQDRVVFSERADVYEDDDAPVEIPAVLREIQSGETRTGKVTNLTAFGAFVDLGGYEGLIHVSELSWSRVGHPRDLLSIGQNVSVFVISANPTQGRIALSLKRAKSDPWHDIEQRYRIGQIIQGVITNVVQFGAFAKVEDDLEGLIHVSELAEGSFLHPRNIVKEGDTVVARVIGVDGHARRLALSLRGIN